MMNATQLVLAEKLNIPDSYKGMDDILIPDAPFKNITSFEKYRFEPIVLINIPEDKLEYDVFVYMNPNIHIEGDSLKNIARKWMVREQKKHHVKLPIKKEGYGKINKNSVYFISYGAFGYDDNRSKLNNFITRIYFFSINEKKTAMVSLVRLDENDKHTELISQWHAFVKSILKINLNAYSLTTKGKEVGTRRYITSDLSFDLPMGIDNGLNQWRNERRAVRGDDWQTPEGEISFRFQITSGYDFKPENENENIKMKADALATGGSDFFESLDSNFSREYESIEHPFGKDHKIYGYKETGRVLTEVKLETAYKTGKTIQILIKTRNEIFDKHEKTIIEWLKHFVILQSE